MDDLVAAGRGPSSLGHPDMAGQSWPQLVIFDCDGVLVDSEVLSIREATAALQREGLAIDEAAVRDRFLGVSLATLVSVAEADLGRGLSSDFSRRLTSATLAAFEREMMAIAGVAEAVQAIDAMVCVASSGTPERIRRSLDIAGLRDLFEPNIYSATMVARGKPHPDLFLHVVIEDSVVGVLAARRAGMSVFGFTGGAHLIGTNQADRLAESGAGKVFADMTALPALIRVVADLGNRPPLLADVRD
jgi:beta-phosphoglucomutase-like phosphatase (HAD superfamily)